jgi:crotonobetaine/carnitine-CoA ligase
MRSLGVHLAGTRRCIHLALEDAVSKDPEADLVTFVGGETYTRGALWDASLRVTAAFEGSGVRAGDRAVIMLGNRIEILATWVGALAGGVLPAPINTAFKGDILRNMLALLDASIVIAEAEHLPNLVPELDKLGVKATLVVVGDPADAGQAFEDAQALVDVSVVVYEAWTDRPPSSHPLQPEPWDPGMILYTSGTTGPSKAVLWPHNMMYFFVETYISMSDYNQDDVIHTALPLFHANALFCTFAASVLAGARCVISPRFSAGSFWQDMCDWDITKTSMMGQMATVLLQRPPSEAESASRVDSIFCIPPPADIDGFKKRYGVEVVQGFGLTDVGIPVGSLSSDASCPPRSIGKLNPGFEALIVDDNDHPLPDGQVGEILLRPTLPFITPLGYWGNPQATVDFTRNLWFHTGDFLRRDEDGWYYFEGRKKDAIKRGGENVSATEVEDVLLGHPSIIEVAVFAVPSDLTEDDVMAALVVQSGASLEDIGQFAEDKLPFFAVPRYYDIRAELPKTQTQKVQKEALREEGITPTSWDRGRVTLKASRQKR